MAISPFPEVFIEVFPNRTDLLVEYGDLSKAWCFDPLRWGLSCHNELDQQDELSGFILDIRWFIGLARLSQHDSQGHIASLPHSVHTRPSSFDSRRW